MARGQRTRALKEMLGVLAPTAATMIGGPLAGMATRALAIGLGLTEDASEAAIEQAVIQADPSQLKELRRIDADLALGLKNAGIKLEEVASADRDSARKREIALRDRAPAVLATVATVGFFGVLGLMFFQTIPEGAERAFDILLGGLIVMEGKVYNYYFGSSAGSAEKNHIIADFKAR